MRTLAFIFTFGILVFVTRSDKIENIDLNINLVFPDSESKKDEKVCKIDDIQAFSLKYQDCFIDKKYKDGGKDLEKLVSRILEHTMACVENSTGSCKPNRKGFVAMMDHVIYQVKDYCHIYLEHINQERDKVKDLQCIERDLLISTYQSCFKDAFVELTDSSSDKYQQKVESAISCTNKLHKSCSRSAKTSLNMMVRTILGVEQPEKEDIEEEVKPKLQNLEEETKPKPQKRWYDTIVQPFISLWQSIKSFFGF